MKNPLRWMIHRIAAKDPLLLSHHPTCKYYNHHTFTLYGTQLCMGCFIVYPVSLMTLLVISVGWLLFPEFRIFTTSGPMYYIVGGIFAAPIVVNKVRSGSRSKRTRIITKTILAIGLGIAAFPFISQPEYRLHTFVLFVMCLVPYIAHKGLTARDDCQGCPEIDDFPDCSGFDFNSDPPDK